MKSQVAPYKRRMECMRVECVDGTIIRLAAHPFDIKVSGQTYLSGYDFTGIEIGTTFTPSSIDLKSFIGFAGITEAMLMTGKFDNAKAYVFATDWNNPVVDYEPICKALFGKLAIEDNKYTVEWMTLIDALNQTVGFTYSMQCPHEFGGNEPGGCQFDLDAATVSSTLTGISNQVFFHDAAALQNEDYFGWGKFWFTSGPNVGIPAKMIKWFEPGFFHLYEPFPYTVVGNETYMASPGCRKHLQSCVIHDQVINHGGFTFVPGDKILKTIGNN
jgi:uncharacterized phage protein (TIGR02218 family)